MSEHPSDHDLINFAREELGARKRARILAHCRECSGCADRLIEATREHGAEREPFRLSLWNKISIGVLLLALVAVVVLLLLTLRGLETPAPSPAEPLPALEEGAVKLEERVDEGGHG